MPISDRYRKTIAQLRNKIKRQNSGEQTNRGGTNGGAESDASKGTEGRINNNTGESDNEVIDQLEDKKIIDTKIYRELLEKYNDETYAEEATKLFYELNLKYSTTSKELSSPEIFSTSQTAGVLTAVLNESHNMYSWLAMIQKEEEIDSLDKESLMKELHQMVYGIKILLYSFARLRDESSQIKQKEIDSLRFKWGEIADDFFDKNRKEES